MYNKGYHTMMVEELAVSFLIAIIVFFLLLRLFDKWI
jgi:hypothetical protein